MMRIVLISGLSGSGKSIALKLLEDIGFICIDNLPAQMLPEWVSYYQQNGQAEQLGISIDIRSRFSLTELRQMIERMRLEDCVVDTLFLTASDEILQRRFAETRRAHPLKKEGRTLQESIVLERAYMLPVQEWAYCLDTTHYTAQQLRSAIRQWLQLPDAALHIVLESFGFKYGIPNHFDYLFDVRCLPNPFYEPTLRSLTGEDASVMNFFEQQPVVYKMINDIGNFLSTWLPYISEENRSYLSIGVGCTGGQHRSVYVVNALAKKLSDYSILVRHRQLLR